MIGPGLLGLRRATPRAPSAHRTAAFDAVASIEMTEPARSVVARFRGSYTTRVAHLRLPAAMARGRSFTPTGLGPDTFCRAGRADNDGDVAARHGRASKPTNKFVDLPR